MKLLKLITISYTFYACNSQPVEKESKIVQTIQSADANDSISEANFLVISERIDGPANVRDKPNGIVFYSLYDNVPVATTVSDKKWLQVGVIIDLNEKQSSEKTITKGSALIQEGKRIGQCLKDIPLISQFRSNEGVKTELVGYTNIANIKTNTIPENALSDILNSKSLSLTIKDFEPFLKNYQFSDFDGLLPNFKGYEIDENWIEDPSPMLRIWILFEGPKFYGVFHSRKLHIEMAKTVKLENGYYFSTYNTVDKIQKELIKNFNNFLNSVD